MNGIYIHIPYCRKVCNYCDFHFSVSLKNKESLINSILKEIDVRKDFFIETEPNKYNSESDVFFIDDIDDPQSQTLIHTVYFGGGTPSVLTVYEIEQILTKIRNTYTISTEAEITFEVNPDDITWEYAHHLRRMGINRLSIGVQSFSDDDLIWMNRRHTGKQAIEAVRLCQEAGFENINLDLIYGFPNLTIKSWQHNLETFFSLDIPHLSAYHLTIEPKTVLGYWKRKGKFTEIDDTLSFSQYNVLIEAMKGFGYQHYEISNFCAEGFYSKHNTNYWKQGRYLGIGPSAHSYNGTSRSWNISVNQQYIDAIQTNSIVYEKEILTQNDSFNDYLLTHLRTSWGVNLNTIKKLFDEKYYRHIMKELQKMDDTSEISLQNNKILLTEKGLFLSDRIISNLFYVD